MCDLPFDAMIIMGDAELTIQTLWLAFMRTMCAQKTQWCATSVVFKCECFTESSPKQQNCKGEYMLVEYTMNYDRVQPNNIQAQKTHAFIALLYG